MSMYYTFLYTQISEDINEMKYKLKSCYKSIVNEQDHEIPSETSEVLRKQAKKKTKHAKNK